MFSASLRQIEAASQRREILLENWLDKTPTDNGDEEDEEEDDVESCSTFSLQQCLEEFRNRRIRRNSAHVPEQRADINQTAQQKQSEEVETSNKLGLGDADLINQNRSNKENERKSKPCKNGFCYCFTSDSGDGGGCGGGTASVSTARGPNQNRYGRRSRKSESSQHNRGDVAAPQLNLPNRVKERRSAPACLKSVAPSLTTIETKTREKKSDNGQCSSNAQRSLMAVSRLETTTHDAPLIHIIQELRDNCVVSEVRVNKHKLQKQNPMSRNTMHYDTQTKKTATRGTSIEGTAPPVKGPNCVQSKEEDTVLRSRLEIKNKSPHRKPGAGRLLQKRLSLTNVQYKQWVVKEPPPKPPRASAGSRLDCSSSVTTTTSTSPSVREAERIVDEFLIQNGVTVPKKKVSLNKVKIPLGSDQKKHHLHSHTRKNQKTYLPTCPSISDIERTVDNKPRSSYGKNIHSSQQKMVKDISFGWKESKVNEMLNYDTNGNRKDFKSQSAQAEPQQSSLGWHIPPKLQIDTVDGVERHNLAANLETKDTPIKRQLGGSGNKKGQNNYRSYPKFGWRNLSPWNPSLNGSRTRKCSKSTRLFLKQSKKKILRLVTPKKDNKESILHARKKTPYRTIGVQTSSQELGSYENSCTPQSPPGSYHSNPQTIITPQQSSSMSNNLLHSQINDTSDSSHFDFSRTVDSPPKRKATRSSQRKLDFPTVCGVTSTCFAQSNPSETEISRNDQERHIRGSRTYRSYHTDLDQDATISKMGFILSNIRARLEASDERAVKTFEEIERREILEQGFDCPDSLGIRQRTNFGIHSNPQRRYIIHEPIYSEIEEASVHVSESPEFDNKTGVESSGSAAGGIDLDTLYAKVVKSPKKTTSSIPLGQFLHDSVRRPHKMPSNRLQNISEPENEHEHETSISNDVSYSSPPLETSTHHSDYNSPTPSLVDCQSLNNVRVKEHRSPPKRNRNLSTSDLSLQRSEVFLQNLCRSELIVDGGTLERLEKIDNLRKKHDSDYISYDVPDDFQNNIDTVGHGEETAGDGGGYGDGARVGTDHEINSCSPQRFLTKASRNSVDVQQHDNQVPFFNTYETHCSSCPVTPQKQPFISSKQQMTQSNSQPDYLNNTITSDSGANSSGFSRYKRLKQALQNSLRKSKNFVKSRRTSLPLNLQQSPQTPQSQQKQQQQQQIEENYHPEAVEMSTQNEGSCLKLDMLIAMDENVPVIEQIVHAVTICRQLPELEITQEMVEAERLLLYTSLRNDTKRQLKYEILTKNRLEDGLKRDFIIKTMRFPGIFEKNLDTFFNYYFTVTFEADGQIFSTQSTEFRNGEIQFRHCNIEINVKKLQNDGEPCINCNIFMLRLRKVDAPKMTLQDENDMQPFDILPISAGSTPNSSWSSLNGITSRFRRYASFTIDALTFKPYAPDDNDHDGDNAVTSDKFCLRASNIGRAPLKLCAQRESVATAITIDGNVTAHFPKRTHCGFLHVQDPYSQHNWNRRWCHLNGLQLEVWTDMSEMNDTPLLCLNLFDNKQYPLPFTTCAPELCARARSFSLQCCSSSQTTHIGIGLATVYFAAENDTDLNEWLQNLNDTLSFIATWMQ